METQHRSKRRRGLSPGPLGHTSTPLSPPLSVLLPEAHTYQPTVLHIPANPNQPTPSLTNDSNTSTSGSISPETPSTTTNQLPLSTITQQDTSNMDSERTIEELYSTDYAPVWAAGTEFPGVIPEEIAEYLYEGIESRIMFIGPVSSLFWLAGVEELIELVDDPVYSLTDECRSIPQGCPRRWIVQILFDEGKIPASMMDKVCMLDEVCGDESCNEAVMIAPGSTIPSNVTDTVSQQRVLDVFPFGRQQSFPQNVSCVKAVFKGKRDAPRNAVELRNTVINSLGGSLLFKGLSRRGLVRLAAFFTPFIALNTLEHEFGPGFYTTPSVEYALGYTGLDGVILVFKDVDFRSLAKLDLADQDWQATIDFWTGASVSDVAGCAPAQWSESDMLEGPVSIPDPNFSRNSRRSPIRRVPGPETQVVGVSHAGLQAFASALHMIIWLEFVP